MNDERLAFGARLRSLRGDRSRRVIVDRMRTADGRQWVATETTLARWEKGTCAPDVDLVPVLCIALGCEPTDLLPALGTVR